MTLSFLLFRHPFGLRTVLGLGEPDLPNWANVREAQLRDARRALPFAWATNLFNAVALVAVLWNRVPHLEVLLWLGAVFALICAAITSVHDMARTYPVSGRTTALGPGIRGLFAGIVWAIPPILFARDGGVEQEIAICLVLGGMIASTPLILAAMPLAMTFFVLPIGLGLMVMMARTGSTILTLLLPVYTLLLIVGGLAAGRAALRRRWAEVTLDEESDIVSLLLGEHDTSPGDWLWRIDAHKRLVDVTPHLALAFSSSIERLHDKSLVSLLFQGWKGKGVPPRQHRDLLDLLDARQSFRAFDLPTIVAGEKRWWRISAMPRHDREGGFIGFQGVGSDVTEQRRNHDRIDRMARADGLTRIDNRSTFEEKLDRAVASAANGGQGCALLLIDLDRFKAVNDTYGHPTGDRLLRAAAHRLIELTAPGDACGRLGGDEFAMLVADMGQQDRIDTIGWRIITALGQPFESDGIQLHIGASIGVARAPCDAVAAEALMRHADLALYQAKRAGRGAVHHFMPEMHDRAERRHLLERHLRHAIDRDEMWLAYQPVVRAGDGALRGFEALLRWSHPELGEVSPAEFVPIANGALLMGRIGEWMLHAACREAILWPETVRLSINLSATQVLDPALPEAVRAVTAAAGLAPDRLEFEIAEATLLRDTDGLREALDRLSGTGTRLILDDFDAGFGCIRQARFDAVKIAPGFLRDANGDDPASVALVRALITVADTLGLETIAKGTETGGQFALARHLGCAKVQSYLSGRPLPAPAATRLANEGGEARRQAA